MAGPRLNKVFLVGRLTRDPELRYTPSGMAVADLGLAVNDDYVKADGSRIERVCFVDVTVWGRTAETSCEYLSKGRPVLIEGRLRMDTWESTDGQKRSKLRVTADRVQFLGGPGQSARAEPPGEIAGPPGEEGEPRRPAAARPQPTREPAESPPEPEAEPQVPPPGEEEDDIPF